MNESVTLIAMISVIILSGLGALTLAVGYLWGLDRGYEIGHEIGQGNNQRPNRQPDSADYKRGT